METRPGFRSPTRALGNPTDEQEMETVAHHGLKRSKGGSGIQAEGKPRRAMDSAETYQMLFIPRDLGRCTLGSFRGGGQTKGPGLKCVCVGVL